MDPISDWVEQPPAPQLRSHVGRYIGYRMLGWPAGIHRGLPAPLMTFIVAIGPPIDVVGQASPAQRPGSYRCVLGGLSGSPALIAHDGCQEGVAIELSPVGTRALFGMPAGAIGGLSVELSDVVGALGDELWERLQGPMSWQQRFTVCDDVLCRLPGRGEVSNELQRSWRLLVGSGGRLTVADLAAETGWSRQHLGRRFRQELGITPKLAAKVMRFDRARKLVQQAEADPLAQVAALCGYYDQAHLVRDFHQLSGCTPTELVAAEELPVLKSSDQRPDVPSVQDNCA
jgi:AraC-like DNA-binding protein